MWKSDCSDVCLCVSLSLCVCRSESKRDLTYLCPWVRVGAWMELRRPWERCYPPQRSEPSGNTSCKNTLYHFYKDGMQMSTRLQTSVILVSYSNNNYN